MESDAQFFGYFETPSILQKLLNLESGDWKSKAFLEKNNDSYIRAKILPLVGVDWEIKDPEFVKNKKNLFEFDIINLHNFFLHKFKGGRISRCIIVSLPPRSTISSHIDDESTEKDAKRFLIPIVTYPEVHYTFNQLSKELQANEMWQINTQAQFGLRNYSHIESIHISVDWNIEA
jgi:hypothetical protein